MFYTLHLLLSSGGCGCDAFSVWFFGEAGMLSAGPSGKQAAFLISFHNSRSGKVPAPDFFSFGS